MAESGVSWRNRQSAQSMPSCWMSVDDRSKPLSPAPTHHGCSAVQAQNSQVQGLIRKDHFSGCRAHTDSGDQYESRRRLTKFQQRSALFQQRNDTKVPWEQEARRWFKSLASSWTFPLSSIIPLLTAGNRIQNHVQVQLSSIIPLGRISSLSRSITLFRHVRASTNSPEGLTGKTGISKAKQGD